MRRGRVRIDDLSSDHQMAAKVRSYVPSGDDRGELAERRISKRCKASRRLGTVGSASALGIPICHGQR